VCKKGDCWSTRHTKEERDKAREGFKRCVYQYLTDNDIDNNFNKDIVPTTTSGSFFYNNYGVEHFMTSNRPIPIKTAKNIVTSINNNAFIHSLTGSTEPGSTEPGNTEPGNTEPSSTEPSTARSNNKGKSTTYFCNNNNDDVNIENLTVDIDFLNCHFDDDG
jgi:hypothetical protein